MKFTIQGPLKDNVYNLMRGISYHFLGKDEKTGEMNFVRPPQGYPRFHIYLKTHSTGSAGSLQASSGQVEDLIFNLHLDQKKPIYEGVPAHSGEYGGELVEKEAERIKQIIK